ncbi:PilZ domain-containing protein [Hydrogenovibrio kuenenii]|uniref:PilZ domain-containing protein n=1 Tax=Hydrogenovibrio kuenenii TaxID=63658 RepID=UPI0004656191|nr:PilZ domain-containing protein [Hydrogenovibrio kuenenii]
MANSRRFFRYDVDIPIYFEKVEEFDILNPVSRSQLMSEAEENHLSNLDDQINSYLEKIFGVESNVLQIFHVLNHRIDFMAWLLDKLISNKDPSSQSEYKFRIRENKKLHFPVIKETSKVKTLIEGMNVCINVHIAELLESVQNNIEGKIFLFPRKVQPLFDPKLFVTNLDTLSEQGVAAAKVFLIIIEKLHLLETVFIRLKESREIISDPDNWPVRHVNLSAGGFRAKTDDEFPRFSVLDVFMHLKHDILICRGKLVACRPVKRVNEDEPKNDLLVEFDFLSLENAQKITYFIQYTELQHAMELDLALV